MNRRDFLISLTASVIFGGFAPGELLAEIAKKTSLTTLEDHDDHIKDYLIRMKQFNKHHRGDIFLERHKYHLLKSSVKRLKRLQQTVGHANFYLLSFDEARKTARNYSRVGRFAKDELSFLQEIFYGDAKLYGFFGDKPIKNLTDRIQRRTVVKIPRTGNYLYKGSALNTYKQIKRQLGNQVILTSGVRSVMKQFLLFLNKAYQNNGNLSLASRSLAPPGCSFHGIGDFDVGQPGFGANNFTERFTTTKAFNKLSELGFINLRYPKDNLLGVRFEPWHVKINTRI